jgi:phage shock protein C
VPRRRLARSNDRVIAGVCAGLAEYVGWPATNMRILYVLVSIFSAAFPGIVVYLILWLLMPEPSEVEGGGYRDTLT